MISDGESNFMKNKFNKWMSIKIMNQHGNNTKINFDFLFVNYNQPGPDARNTYGQLGKLR